MLYNFSQAPAAAHQCFCSSIPAFAIQNQLNELLVLIHGLQAWSGSPLCRQNIQCRKTINLPQE